MAQCGQPDEVEWLQRHVIARQSAQRVGDGGQGGLLTRVDCLREGIERRLLLRQKAVDHQKVSGEADRRQFAMSPRSLAERGVLGAGDEDETCALAVRQGLDRLLVLRPLLGEARKRAEARGVAFPGFEKAAPRHGELQQSDGVAGGRRVENDVVETRGQLRIREQRREFVEGGDFRRAGSRELLLDAFHHGVGQLAAHGVDNAVPIGLRGGLWIDLQGEQAFDS